MRARQLEAASRYDAEPGRFAPPISIEEAARWQLPIQPSDDYQADDRARDRIDGRLFVAFALIVVVYFAAQFGRAAL